MKMSGGNNAFGDGDVHPLTNDIPTIYVNDDRIVDRSTDEDVTGSGCRVLKY